LQLVGNAGQAVIAALTVPRTIGRPVGQPPEHGGIHPPAAIAGPAVASAVAAYLFVLTRWAADFGLTRRRRFLTKVIPTLTLVPLDRDCRSRTAWPD
jgi:hypothetical protein